MKIYNLFQSMWILEHWKICAESPTEVRRKFRLAFNLRYDQLPHIWAYKREYMRIKKTKSADHLVGGKKVSPDRFKMTPECQNLEQVAAVKEHARKVDSGMSLRDRSLDLDIPRATIHTILRYNIGMKAWKILEVQELKPHHYPARKGASLYDVRKSLGFFHPPLLFQFYVLFFLSANLGYFWTPPSVRTSYMEAPLDIL